jgi:hypothetical protein
VTKGHDRGEIVAVLVLGALALLLYYLFETGSGFISNLLESVLNWGSDNNLPDFIMTPLENLWAIFGVTTSGGPCGN